MFGRLLKTTAIWQPVLMTLLCSMLMFCAVPVTCVFQVLVAEEDVEPLEEDEAPLEDPFDAGSLPQRLSPRDELRSDFVLRSEQQWGPASKARAGVCGTMDAAGRDEFSGRNGCGATLRC